MARYFFGRETVSWADNYTLPFYEGGSEVYSVILTPNVEISFWTHRTGGTQYGSIINGRGEEIPAIRTSPDGRLPLFQGPEDVLYMWAESGVGPRTLLIAHEAFNIMDERVEEIITLIESIGSVDQANEMLDELEGYRDEILGDLQNVNLRALAAQARINALMATPKRGQLIFYGRRTSPQTITNNTFTAIQFNGIDTNVGVWNGTAPTDIVIQVPGLYQVNGFSSFTGNSSGVARSVQVWRNGEGILGSFAQRRFSTTGPIATPPTPSTPVQLNAGDVLRLVTRQNSGSSLTTVNASLYYPSLQLVYLEP
jgi:hypothetical protein